MSSEKPQMVRIFISSPGDVAEERERARAVVERLRKRYVGRLILEPVLWEGLPLTADMSFQEGIDQVILSETHGIDVAVFILWSRLGSPPGPAIASPDGTDYRSGTEREFDLMLRAYEQSGCERPQILAYVRDDQDGFVDQQRGKDTNELVRMVAQRKLVDQFIKEEFHDPDTGANLRAYHTFPTPSTFAVRLRQHLRGILDEIAAEAGVPVEQQWEDDPYRGLQAFDIEHAPIFFGREEETARVLEALQAQQRAGCAFVLVVGASGSGKSSLVRAGVIPELVENGDEEGIAWRRAILTPGESVGGLLAGLARALFAAWAIPEFREDEDSLRDLAEDFAESPKQAAKQVRRVLQRVSTEKAQVNLVLLVDQFEEVFTHAAFSESDIAAFTAALHALAECGRVAVLTTVRSDYYGQCQQIADLIEMKAPAGQIDLVAPGQAALARIVVRPAQLAGLRFEENRETGETLDQRILADIGSNPEALPLVEFLLTQLWENRSPEGVLTFEQYKRLGGVEGAIGHHAEDTFTSLPDDVRAAFGAVFNALVTLDESEDAQPVRRRVAADTVRDTPAKKQLVDALVAARLLSADGGEVSVSHEALLRRWPRAVDWITENREFLRVRTQVNQRRKQSGVLLPDDPLFDLARLEVARNRNRFSTEESTFITEAVVEAERKEKRARRIRRSVMAGLIALTVLALAATAWAWTERQKTIRTAEETERQRDRATASERLARESEHEIRRQAAQSHFLMACEKVDQGRSDLALSYLVRALDRHPGHLPAKIRLQTLLAGRAWPRLVADLPTKDGFVAVAFSRDGGHVVAADRGCVGVWHAADGTPDGGVFEHRGLRCWAAFTSVRKTGRLSMPWDSTLGAYMGRVVRWYPHLADVGTQDGDPVVAWGVIAPDSSFVAVPRGKSVCFSRLPDGAPIASELQHQHAVRDIAFSPDGTRLATLSGTLSAWGVLTVWSLSTGEAIARMNLSPTVVWGCPALSADGRLLVICHGSNATVWDLEAPDDVTRQLRHDGPVHTAAFSSDGRWIVTASQDGTARIWDAGSGKCRGRPMRHGAPVYSALFSSSNSLIVTSCEDGTARIWYADTSEPFGHPMRHNIPVAYAELSPDGNRVLTLCRDGKGFLWDPDVTVPTEREVDWGRWSKAGTLAPDAQSVAVWKDNSIRVLNAFTGHVLCGPISHQESVRSVAFSPDSRSIVSASNDGTARVWGATTGRPLSEPMPHDKEVASAMFSPDGNWVVTASRDGTARVWEAATGRPSSVPMIHDGAVVSAVFSPDSRWVLTTSEAGNARVWEGATGNIISGPVPHLRFAKAASFSPDGRFIITVANPESACVWEAANAKPVAKAMCHGQRLGAAFFGAGGKLVVTTGRAYPGASVARAWRVATGEPLGAPMDAGGGFSAARISPDDRFFTTLCNDGAVRLWEIASGALLFESRQRKNTALCNAECSSQGLEILTFGGGSAILSWVPFTDARLTRDDVEGAGDLAAWLGGSRFSAGDHGLEWVSASERITIGKRLEAARQDDTSSRLTELVVGPVLERAIAGFVGQTVREYLTTHPSVLLSAALEGRCAEVDLCLAAGIDPDTADDRGRTALWPAIVNRNETVLQSLLAAGANVEVHDAEGSTPLLLAVEREYGAAVGVLVSAGANVNVATSAGVTPLALAAEGRLQPVVQFLLHHGAEPDLRSIDGWTPLMRACNVTAGHLSDIVAELLENGASATARDPAGWRALMLAASHGHVETGRLLLEGGAEIDARKEDGLTALGVAVANGQTEFARLMLRHGANPRAMDCRGYTAATWASGLGNCPELLPGIFGVDSFSVEAVRAKADESLYGQQMVVEALVCASDLAKGEKETKQARELLEEALSAIPAEHPKVRLLRQLVLERLAEVCRQLRNRADALRYRATYVDLLRETVKEYPVLKSELSAALSELAWSQELSGVLEEALRSATEAVGLLEDDKPCPARMNLAHACLFADQFDKAKAIYVKYANTTFVDGRKWNDEVRKDFRFLREAGHDHPDMKKIEALLGTGEDEAEE